MTDPVMTPDEAARMLRLPESTVRRMGRDGRLSWLRGRDGRPVRPRRRPAPFDRELLSEVSLCPWPRPNG